MADLGVTVALHSEYGVVFFSSSTPVITAYERLPHIGSAERADDLVASTNLAAMPLRQPHDEEAPSATAGLGSLSPGASRGTAPGTLADMVSSTSMSGVDEPGGNAGGKAASVRRPRAGEWSELNALLRYYGHRSDVIDLQADGPFLLSRSRRGVLMHAIRSGSLLWRHEIDESQVMWMELAPAVTHFDKGPGVLIGLANGDIVGCQGALHKPLTLEDERDLNHMPSAAAYSKRFKLLLVGSNDFSLRAFRGARRRMLGSPRDDDQAAMLAWKTKAHVDEITCLAMDDPSGHVFTGAAGREKCNCVIAYDTASGKFLWKGVGHTRGVVALAAVHAKRAGQGASTTVVVSGSWDRTVRGWNGADGTQLWCGDAHSGAITHLATDSSAAHAGAAGGGDAQAAAAAAAAGVVGGDALRPASPVHTPHGRHVAHTHAHVRSHGFDSGLVFSGSSDKSVVCWSPLDGRVLWHSHRLPSWVSGFDTDPKARELIAACGTHGTAILAYGDGRVLWSQRKSSEVVSEVSVCTARRVYYRVNGSGGISAWDVVAKLLWAVQGRFDHVLAQALPLVSPKNTSAGAGAGAGEAKAAVSDPGESTGTGWGSTPGSLVFASQQNSLVCLDADDGVRVWRTAAIDSLIIAIAETHNAIVSLHDDSRNVHGTNKGTGDELWVCNVGECPPRVVLSATTNGTVFTGCAGGIVCGINEAGKLFWQASHERGVNCLAFSEAFGLLLSGSDDRLVKAWRGGKCIWEGEGHAGGISAVLIVEATRASYSGSLDGSVVRRDGTGAVLARNCFRHPVRGLTVAGGPVGASTALRGRAVSTGAICAADAAKAMKHAVLFVQLDFAVAACSVDNLDVLYTIEPTMGSIRAVFIDAKPIASPADVCIDAVLPDKYYVVGCIKSGGCVCLRRRRRKRTPQSSGALSASGSTAVPTSPGGADLPPPAMTLHKPTLAYSWGAHGEFTIINTEVRAGITKARVEVVPARHRTAAARAMVGYIVWVDFLLMLGTRATDVIQLIAFVSVTSTWGDVLRELMPVVDFAGDSTPFGGVFALAAVVAVVFLALLGTSEHIELNKFKAGNTGPWVMRWMFARLMCRTAAVSWLVPIMRVQLEGVTCTGRASELVGGKNLDLMSFDHACYEGVNLVIGILAALVIVWFMPAAYRLLRVRGNLDQVDVLRNPMDWSLDVLRDGFYLQVASMKKSAHLVTIMGAKLLFVGLALFAPGGTKSVASAVTMLVASVLIMLVGSKSPPFFPTSRKLNASVAGLDWLVVFLVSLNLVEAIVTDGGTSVDGLTESYKTTMALLLVAGPLGVAPLCGTIVYYVRHARRAPGAHEDELGVPGAAALLHAGQSKGDRVAHGERGAWRGSGSTRDLTGAGARKRCVVNCCGRRVVCRLSCCCRPKVRCACRDGKVVLIKRQRTRPTVVRVKSASPDRGPVLG